MTWTTHSAAPEWGINVKTLRGMLVKAGHDLNTKKHFTTEEVSRAVHAAGDYDAERIRETRARADSIEIDNRERLGELMDRDEATKICYSANAPLQQQLKALPSWAPKFNPADPLHAKAAAEEYLKTILPLIRDELPKPIPTE